MRPLALCGLLLLGASAARAQIVSIGVHGALGDYREASSALHFTGTGGGVSLGLKWRKFTVEAEATRINYEPSDNSSLQDFKSTEAVGRFGYQFTSSLTGEVGYLNRTIDPQFAAQEMGAIPIGLRYVSVLGRGASIGIRGDYLAAAKFTGGGSAPLALELGLFLSAGTSNGRFRFTGEYGFQRIDRKANSVKAPIQQSLARLGVAVGF